MAVNIGRDIIVDGDEWDAVLTRLKQADTDFNDTFNEYLKIMNNLKSFGIIRGTRHDNLEAFYNAAKLLKDVSTEYLGNIETAIRENLVQPVEEADKYDG